MAAGIGISLSIWLMSVIAPSSFSSIPNGVFSEEMIEFQMQMVSRTLVSFTPLGIIPLLIGAVFMILHFVEKRQSANENA